MNKTNPILNLSTLEDHMVFVEGGTFDMGGESGHEDSKPIHQVEVKNFHLCRYLVTQELWEQVMGSNPAAFSYPLRPVEQVSWYEAVEFCNRLSEKLGKQAYYDIDENQKDPNNLNDDDDQKWLVKINADADGYHLPSEAEWEYAARGGKYKGELEFAGSNNLHEVAWHSVDNVEFGNALDISQPVALKRPNSLGLYDMSGNVVEWCWDWFHDEYYQKCIDEKINNNPSGPNEGTSRVVRGGSWGYNGLDDFRPAYRINNPPDIRDSTFGFRLSRY